MILLAAVVIPKIGIAMDGLPSTLNPTVIVNTQTEPIAPGKFQPTWESLEQYQCPDWYRNAKFGIWAHWGPQCEPEQGDWYARDMYIAGSRQNKYHIAHYGSPAEFGFKDVIHEWKAENWHPEDLMALYKRAGAQYFFALANHHDNFDLWNSKYHAWNATKIGPQKDLIAGWAKAARDQGMKFGVSVHAAHAWMWYEPSQDYDGKLTLADGKGKWWDGLDPQELYAQNHERSKSNNTNQTWNWQNGTSQPDQAYCDAFYNRTADLINQVHPDLVYFDDTALPLWPVSDAGLKLAAHFYNSNMQQHDGKLEAVLFGKILDAQQAKCMVWDIERGQSNKIEPLPWQSDTCIGNWHYNREIYNDNHYKSAATVIRTLADVVSKNGNLLLSIPVRADGTIDEKERAIVEEVATWMETNREAIFDTRPWKVCGEGPQLAAAAELKAQGFNEGKGKPMSGEDVRYTSKGETLYALVLGKPPEKVKLTSLGTSAKLLDGKVTKVEQLGAGDVKWKQGGDALEITPNVDNIGKDQTVVFRISTRS
jgi:alpha-L-fucosidase